MSTLTALGTPIQGVTLYSFTRLFHSRKLAFDELIREVARRGLGPGLEIVGFQSIRNFPNVSDEFASSFRSLIDEVGLIPTALGANADAGLRRDRRLTNDELVEYMTAQILAAKKLGFRIVRVQFSVTPDDMERLLPIAEREDIALGMELHAPHSVHHPVMQALLERYEKLGSPLLGFIPDWGSTMDRMPRTLIQKYRDRGVKPELVDAVDDFWNTLHSQGAQLDDVKAHEYFGEIVELAHSHGENDLAIELAVNATELFGHGSPEEWAEILPWAVHTHGKFYELDADGNETAVPIPKILEVFVENGYSKTISTEWEGFHWNNTSDPFDMIAGQQALVRRTVDRLGSHVVTDAAEARELTGFDK
ncbi:sugar phosphate isomerase/epimerase family protein [Leifsonia sp. NPDC058194]|uniref:sugar phosphate isomerase/epimerase family protein n=1 Tax=Leifsonia sp. NPDC058194 TaxID=3346374 RepID=UPI0036DA9BD4